MEKSTIVFHIDRAWIFTYNKVCQILTEIIGIDPENIQTILEELGSQKEFPIIYLLRCDKKFETQIVEALKKINSISNVHIPTKREVY
jgi:hypothetical protein